MTPASHEKASSECQGKCALQSRAEMAVFGKCSQVADFLVHIGTCDTLNTPKLPTLPPFKISQRKPPLFESSILHTLFLPVQPRVSESTVTPDILFFALCRSLKMAHFTNPRHYNLQEPAYFLMRIKCKWTQSLRCLGSSFSSSKEMRRRSQRRSSLVSIRPTLRPRL